MVRFSKVLFAGALIASSIFTTLCGSATAGESGDDRLMIVNGASGHVVYDDGHDDLFCVTRRHIVGYDDYGRRIYRRTMRCR